MMRGRWILAAATAALIAAPIVSAAAGPEVPFPLGYRSWTHIKSAWVGEGNPAFPRFAGLHHIYGNAPAMTGFRSGTFPVGAVVVFDVLETKAGTGSLVTGKRRFRDVMEKTGEGWRFTEFNGESHTERNVTTDAAVTQCAGCHAGAKQDHVFSTYTESDDR